MSDTFYVVSRETADSGEYLSAVAFNRGDKDADNESAANEYAGERKAAAPWHSHTVMSVSEFAALTDPETKSDSADDADPETKSDSADDADATD